MTKVLVVGATGGSGRATVEELLRLGHTVTAFSRTGDDLGLSSAQLRAFAGDVSNAQDVARAVRSQDAVIITLGISENPLRVRILGPRHTSMDVRSRGTHNVIRAMQTHGVRRLVALTSYGVGPTRARLGAVDRLLFAALLAPQIADTEQQQHAIEASGLDWVSVQPVHLTNADDAAYPLVSTDGSTGKMQVSRKSVARFLATAATQEGYVRQTVSLSGALVAQRSDSRCGPSCQEPESRVHAA
jgi:uncharacterized protein YbjT (DUF2867 family)